METGRNKDAFAVMCVLCSSFVGGSLVTAVKSGRTALA